MSLVQAFLRFCLCFQVQLCGLSCRLSDLLSVSMTVLLSALDSYVRVLIDNLISIFWLDARSVVLFPLLRRCLQVGMPYT